MKLNGHRMPTVFFFMGIMGGPVGWTFIGLWFLYACLCEGHDE